MRRRRLTASMLLLTALALGTAAQAAPAGVQAQAARESAQAAGIQKTTFLYATKNGEKLYLDRIVDTSVKVTGKRPAIIYSFGGGWEGGARSDPIADSFLDHLASTGYVVIAIDYRLGIKEAKAKGEFTPATAKDMYLRAIQWGVEDLFDATAYVLRNADAWNVDKGQIAILGSSAGATASLVAEYNLVNATPLALAHLPADFRYSGVVSMAGAFWLKGDNTPLTFKSAPAPIMFFHGSKDPLVTYDEVHAGFSGYGPAYFTRHFPGYPKWFVDVIDGGHVMAVAPMLDYRDEIDAFLRKLVKEKQRISVHSIEVDTIAKTFPNFQKLYGARIAALLGTAPQK